MNVLFTTSMTMLLCFHCSFSQVRKMVINEFMFDPSPAVNLPDAEYVELLNISEEAIYLSGWTLNDRPIPEILLMPGQLIVLCELDAIILFGDLIQTAGLESWDKLNNEGQAIILKDGNGQIVDSLAYAPDWIKDPSKRQGGWSLERINPFKTCSDVLNWAVSLNLNGGTPGFTNSVFSILKDTSPPGVKNVECIDVRSIRIRFTETVDFGFQSSGQFFELLPEKEVTQFQHKGFSDIQVLHLASALDSGKIYQLHIRNIQDCEQNTMPDTLVPLGIGVEPVFNDILITELMVDEVPSVGLPESEYIELLNLSSKLLSLKDTYIFSDSTRYDLPGTVIFPGYYYLLIPASRVALFEGYEHLIPLEKFPRLLNNGRMLTLYHNQNGWLFSLEYDKQWYKNAYKSEGGYALEMIDTQNPCGDIRNWEASKATIGGTPGYDNSVKQDNPDLRDPEIVSAYAFEKGMISIRFSEKLHPDSFKNISLRIDRAAITDQWTFDTLTLDRIELGHALPATEATPYTIEISGARDCVDNFMKPEHSYTAVHIPAEPGPGDIIINEIMFNPRPGGVDWIELYNLSGRHLDLVNCFLSSGKGLYEDNIFPLTPGHFIQDPTSYLVLTTDTRRLISHFPSAKPEKILEVPELPAMPDQEGQLTIWTAKSQQLDEVIYTEDQHSPLIRETEGISLERVSPFKPGLQTDNWHSASSNSGYGTPTLKNSQYRENAGQAVALRIQPRIFSPDQDGYDDQLQIEISSPKPGYTAYMYVFNLEGRAVKDLTRANLLGSSEVFTWDGIQDNGLIAKPGNYILLVELFHPERGVTVIKEKFAVAIKL